ncbi:MAG: hypothetical protein K6G26_10115, partial [Lachnospiraceae bacterium]|nr:hypothetical protein [Lachnospiraceae bacterium]
IKKLDEYSDEVIEKHYDLKNSSFVCEVKSVDFTNKTINCNKVEYLTFEDEKRIQELGITDDMSDGYYIYDEKEDNETFEFSDDIEFYRLLGNWTLKDNLKNIEKIKDTYYFYVYTEENVITAIKEVYQS